ncbi:MAG TPA: hypothetical protein VMF06_21565 [Candidatus Limnocylindria bacterium]|jgi:hypothetical protein|nr:hypothetical protein [Candidatus Limnocylindria bacterium]
MSEIKRAAFIIGLLAVAIFLLPLVIGIWLPDIFGTPVHTLGSLTLTNGYSFRVVQYWNHSDFYTTDLLVMTPGGKTNVMYLDMDDNKTWQVPLKVDEQKRTITVILSGHRARTNNW